MSFLDEFNAQNNPSTQSNEPEQRKLSRAEKAERGKKRIKGLVITFIVGGFLLILAFQGLGNLMGAQDKPAAFSSVPAATAATIEIPASESPTASNMASPVTTPTTVPADKFSTQIDVRVYDKMLQDVAYHAMVINQKTGDAVLDKDFAAGDDLSITDDVLIPTADVATAVRPSYLVTITSSVAGVGGEYVITANKFQKASGDWHIACDIVIQGTKFDDTYHDFTV